MYPNNDFRNYISSSSDHLEHHGILGQKWGVRRYQNPDGTLTEEGKKRYLSNYQVNAAQTIYKNSRYNEDVSDKIFDITGADKTYLKNAKEELQKNVQMQNQLGKELDETFKELRDSKVKTYYEAASEIAAHMSLDVSQNTLDDIGWYAYMGVAEDGQQSDINAYTMYAYKNKDINELKEKLKSYEDSRSKSMEISNDLIQNALDKVGGENLMSSEKSITKMSSGLSNRIRNSIEEKIPFSNAMYQLYYLDNLSMNDDYNKKAINKAEKIVKNIKNPGDYNTWIYFSKAVDNLGMSSARVNNLSKSDWDKINEEISKLKQ